MHTPLCDMHMTTKIDRIRNEFPDCAFETVSFAHHALNIRLFHRAGDYIPARVAAEKQFYEAHFLNFFSFFNSANGVVLDIGGNIGNHSVFFSAVKGWDVMAFEPVRQNALCLAINAELNHVSDKITLLETALGSTPGCVVLSKTITNNNGTFSRSGAQSEESVSVPVSRLDDVPEIQACSPGLMKVDVEGMEYDVLLGALETLERHKPALAFECPQPKAYQEILALVAPLGYFPIEVLNATPTFILLNKHNEQHVQKLSEYLTMYVEARRATEY